jgi:hypothetical protein
MSQKSQIVQYRSLRNIYVVSETLSIFIDMHW